MKARSCVPVVIIRRWLLSSSMTKLLSVASRLRSASVAACSSISALTSTSFRCQPSMVTEPLGAPVTVTVPAYKKRRLSCRVMVRVRSGPAGMTGFLFFCAATGGLEATAQTRDRTTVRTKIALFAVFTDWIVRENERVCLALDEINVALVGRDRDRSPPVTDVAGDSASFAQQFHAVVPESAQRNFLGGRGRHQMK